MKKNNFYVGYIILILISCKGVKPPIYLGTQNVFLSKVGINESLLKATIKFYNPNKQIINFKKAAINVYLENRFLGKIINDSLKSLPALDTSYIPITGNISMQNFLANAATMVLKDSVLIRLDGKVKAGMYGMYKNVPINYESKQSISKLLKDSTIR